MSWYEWGPTRPREAKGGIKARNKRGAFAESWWGRRWIEVLESFNIGERLGRGRAAFMVRGLDGQCALAQFGQAHRR